MPSFQISITPSRRAATRFISHVRRTIQRALAEEEAVDGIKQADIARAIGVNRSVIHREIRGHKDITLGRLAELAWALGREPVFDLAQPEIIKGENHAPIMPGAHKFVTAASLTNQTFYQPSLGGIAKAA